MRILVTGGAGFIGSALVDELTAGGHELVVLDEREPVSRPGVTAVTGDVREAQAWESALPGVEAVAHLAAKVGLGVDLGDLEDYVGINDGGTATGLLALHRAGFAGRLVLASSMVVYGEGAAACPEHGLVRPGPRRREDREAGRWEPRCPGCGSELAPASVSEDAPVDPRNVYAATKLHQEHLCAAYGRERGASVVALRYHNVYGPGLPRDTPYAGVASLFLSAMRRGERPTVMEDGRQRRDFVHVRDVARATALALTAEGAVEGASNVASGTPRTVGDLAEALADALGPTAPRPVVVGGYRLGDVRHVVASPARAGEVLGFRAEVPFTEGIASLVDDT
ncbi:NAD-dependent epimerase/dehydratase family protein [soil metagenome]